MSDEAYLRELSEVGRRHGLGLTGHVQLYELAPEDYLFAYSTTRDGIVSLGSPGDADADSRAGSRRDAESRFDADAPANVEQKDFRVDKEPNQTL